MNIFETTDIVLAAALKVYGYNIINIRKLDGRGTFIFGNVPTSVINDYDLGNMLVEPVAFNTAIRALTTAARR